MFKKCLALLTALLTLFSSALAVELSPDALLTTVGDYSGYGAGDMTPYDEPLEVSLGISINLSRAFPEGDGYENNVWSRYFQDKLNIQLKLAFTTSDLTDKVNSIIATGDLPDVLQVTADQLKMLSSAGLIRDDIYEVYDQHAGSAIRQLVQGFDEKAVIEGCSFDGKMMALPILNASPGEKAVAVWIRKDWLDTLGLELPKNYADLRAIMEAFTKDDPDRNGVDDTTGLVFCKGMWNQHFRMDGFFNIFGAFPYQGYWVTDPEDETQAVYGAFQPEVKAALQELNSLYQEGILDNDFAIYDENTAKAVVCSGQCGVVFSGAYSPNTFLYASVENDPNADWVAVPVPGLESETTPVTAMLPIRSYLVFRKDFEHPEAVFKMINVYYDLCYSEDTTQEIYDTYVSTSQGNSSYTAFSIYPWGYFQPVFQNERSALYINSGVKSTDPSLPGFARSFADGVEQYEAGDKTMWRWYRFFGPQSGHMVTSRYISEDLYAYNRWYGPSTDTMSENMSLIYDLVQEMILKIIMGQESPDAFEGYRDTAYALGLDMITDEVNAWLKENE